MLIIESPFMSMLAQTAGADAAATMNDLFANKNNKSSHTRTKSSSSIFQSLVCQNDEPKKQAKTLYVGKVRNYTDCNLILTLLDQKHHVGFGFI